MNSKVINIMWSISLMVIGITTVILLGTNILAIELPDIIIRVLGAIDLVCILVLTFSTVKKAKIKK